MDKLKGITMEFQISGNRRPTLENAEKERFMSQIPPHGKLRNKSSEVKEG
jgi:hypothetical protein